MKYLSPFLLVLSLMVLTNNAMLRDPHAIARATEAAKGDPNHPDSQPQSVYGILAYHQSARARANLKPYPFREIELNQDFLIEGHRPVMHIFCGNPLKQSDGSKIFYALGFINGQRRILKTRYHADDTLDRSFGNNGVDASEIISSNTSLTEYMNQVAAKAVSYP